MKSVILSVLENQNIGGRTGRVKPVKNICKKAEPCLYSHEILDTETGKSLTPEQVNHVLRKADASLNTRVSQNGDVSTPKNHLSQLS
jgi:hypothetical protein